MPASPPSQPKPSQQRPYSRGLSAVKKGAPESPKIGIKRATRGAPGAYSVEPPEASGRLASKFFPEKFFETNPFHYCDTEE